MNCDQPSKRELLKLPKRDPFELTLLSAPITPQRRMRKLRARWDTSIPPTETVTNAHGDIFYIWK